MQVYFDFLRDNLSLVNVYGNTQTEINRVYTFLNSAIKYEDKQATYTEKYKNGYGKEYVNFYDKDERTVPIGLIARVCDLLRGRFPGIQLKLAPRIDSMFRPKTVWTKEEIIKYAETLNIHDRKEGSSSPFVNIRWNSSIRQCCIVVVRSRLAPLLESRWQSMLWPVT